MCVLYQRLLSDMVASLVSMSVACVNLCRTVIITESQQCTLQLYNDDAINTSHQWMFFTVKHSLGMSLCFQVSHTFLLKHIYT